MVQKKVLLLCGYRTSGKDTVYSKLIDQSDHNWLIFSIDKNSVWPWTEPKENFTRKALADELKIEARRRYHLPHNILEKDKPQFLHPLTGVVSSARDFYVELATKKRAKDLNYWCRKLSLDDLKINVITDFRFQNEHNYFFNLCDDLLLKTARIYRSDVSIPKPLSDSSIDSEHNLDTFLTDYLLIPDSDNWQLDLAKAINQFPQYESCHLVGIL